MIHRYDTWSLTVVLMAQEAATEENLWESILAEASHSVADRLESKTVLVVGDRLCGKSTLLARLEGIDIADIRRGFALDYSFIDIHTSPDQDEGDLSEHTNN